MCCVITLNWICGKKENDDKTKFLHVASHMSKCTYILVYGQNPTGQNPTLTKPHSQPDKTPLHS